MNRLSVVSPVYRIIFIYLVFGVFWFTVFDRLLQPLISVNHSFSVFQTYNGLVFIALSSILLYSVARSEIKKHSLTDAKLRDSEEKYHSLLQYANDGIVIADAETGLMLDVNRKIEHFTGRPVQDLIGRPIEELHPPRQRERCRQLLQKAFKRKSTIIEDLCVLNSDTNGVNIPVEISANIVDINNKKVIQEIFRDIRRRKKAEEQALYRLDRLSALHAIDLIISSSLDLSETLKAFLDLVTSQLHVDASDVLLMNTRSQMLEYAAMHGFRNAGIQRSPLRLGDGLAGQAALEHHSIGIANLFTRLDTDSRLSLLKGEDFIGYYVVPLVAKGRVTGVLEVFHRSSLDFSDEDKRFLEALAAQAAIAIDNAALFKDLQQSTARLTLAYDTTIEGWSRALELRDQETEGHTQRASELTLRIARAMDMSDEDIVHLRRGAMLHDIGKMSIPDSILLKSGPLSEEEWKIMRQHPIYAYELLSPIAYLRPALDIPYCHHERWDGTGYPRGLKGDEIPLAARIFALADTWDALYSERRYHTAWPEKQVIDHIRSLAGTQLDPKIVSLFLELQRTGKLQENVKS